MAKFNFRRNSKKRKSKIQKTNVRSGYKSPGVYIEEISKFPPSVAQVPTAIPAFVGYTEKHEDPNGNDLCKTATKINSLLDFENNFGKQPNIYFDASAGYTIKLGNNDNVVGVNAKQKYFLYHSIELFFANGGGACYVISVGNYSNDITYGDKSAGMRGGLEILSSVDEPTMIVVPDAMSLNPTDRYSFQQDMLAQCAKLRDRFGILDIGKADSTVLLEKEITDFRDHIGSANLEFGAAYAPWIKTVTKKQHWYHDLNGNIVRKGTHTPIDLYTLARDLPPKGREKIQKILQTLDETIPGTISSDETIIQLEKILASLWPVYRDILNEVKNSIGIVPPSGMIAGIYAMVDNARGVWKAPANVSLNGVVSTLVQFDEKFQEHMNVDPQTGKSINAIRSFPGKGVMVWGARTLAGNDNEWRYIPVRRFFNMVEESVKKSTEQFVFEPNDANTWAKIESLVQNYLTLLWRQGALAGAKPGDAFFIDVGLNKTMTTTDIQNGKLIIRIGMAVVRPAEFIILEFTHKMTKS